MRVSTFVTACLLAGCTPPTGPESRFGHTYRLVATGGAPELFSGSLLVGLEYSGCSENHEFDLRYRRTPGNVTIVWLHKVTPDEPCDMLFTETQVFPLPPTVGTDPVLLIGPGGYSATVPRNPCGSAGTGFQLAVCSMAPPAPPARAAVAT